MQSTSEVEPDSVRLRLEAPERVAPGDAVPMTIVVENVTERSLDLYLRGRAIAFDLVVSGEDGAVVWRRLEGEIIPAILRIETLGPGESLELSDSWPQRTNTGDPVPPGRYLVRGEVLAEDPAHLVTPPREVRITPE